MFTIEKHCSIFLSLLWKFIFVEMYCASVTTSVTMFYFLSPMCLYFFMVFVHIMSILDNFHYFIYELALSFLTGCNFYIFDFILL